jgi:DNA-directed RNA polymerase subunit B
MYSERGIYKSLQEIKKEKDGVFTYSFGNFKNIPIFLLIKALGLTKDQEILELLKLEDNSILFQLSEFSGITIEEAYELLGKRFKLFGNTKEKNDRIDFYLNNFVLPHIGITEECRVDKAKLIIKLFKKYFNVSTSETLVLDDKDHYGNKRIKLVGKLFEQMFIGSFKDLIVDILTNFQRMMKRGKFQSTKLIIREQLLTQKINSALAMGVWSDGRKGVAQYLKRENFSDTLSHLTRVISPLSSSQENFLARELHPTFYGRLCPFETPEGGSIGLRKNLAMMTEITYENSVNYSNELLSILKENDLIVDSNEKIDIFLDNRFVGSTQNSNKFLTNFKKLRRTKKINSIFNLFLNEENNSISIDGGEGRLRRPLIIVKNGKSMLTEKILNDLRDKKINYNHLLEKEIIEYLDASEEDNSLVGFTEEDLSVEHTHLELIPSVFLGVNTGTTPFLEYDEASRLIRGQKTIKQSVGLYATNYQIRKETDRNVLISPSRPLVSTFFYDLMKMENHPAGQNMTVAIMSYEGYNMEDGIILNKGSLDLGMQRSFYYKIQGSSEVKYPGGLNDKIKLPSEEVKGYRLPETYRFLDTDGIVNVGTYVKTGDALIGKISPPKFNEDTQGFGQMVNLELDSTLVLKEDEKGRASKIFILENKAGDKEVNVILRDQRIPVVGDKFASRHGQKGIIGGIFKKSDIPFTENGIFPDIITSPHSIPGRKTVSHIIEVLGGKVAALRGELVDGSAYDGEKEYDLRVELEKMGFNNSGAEVMYDPKTGKKMNCQIYVGSIYYLRLKHQVENKLQARGIGPIQLLTRQPSEGRARGGGLKLGEMEKDALISHGASLLLKERFSADQTTALVCQGCGYLTDPYLFNYSSKCTQCNSNKFEKIELAYAFKLFINELRSLGMDPKFKTKDRYFDEDEDEKIIQNEKIEVQN